MIFQDCIKSNDVRFIEKLEIDIDVGNKGNAIGSECQCCINANERSNQLPSKIFA